MTLSFRDNDRLREVAGEMGSHLDTVARLLDLAVHHRGAELRLKGPPDRVRAARAVFEGLYDLVGSGHSLHGSDVAAAVRILAREPGARLQDWFRDTLGTLIDGRPIVARSVGQRDYVAALVRSQLVFGVGPAGTGKTWLAVAAAVAALKRGDVRRLILTRPAVEAGEKLGFLPGDLAEKVDPYLRPLFDALADMIPQERFARMVEKRVIEVAPLAFMRGRTLDHAVVLLDEAQNATREQMKMFLTRLGQGSRMIVTGDPTQVDLPPRVTSGLLDALEVVSNVEGVDICRLDEEDVVRHPLVGRIVRAYARRDGR